VTSGVKEATIKAELLEGAGLLMEDQIKMADMEDLIVVFQAGPMEGLRSSRVHIQLPTWGIKVAGVVPMGARLEEGCMLLVHMAVDEVLQLVVVDSNSGMYFWSTCSCGSGCVQGPNWASWLF